MMNDIYRVAYLADGSEEQVMGRLVVQSEQITITSKFDGLSPSGFLCIRQEAIVSIEADSETSFYEKLLAISDVSEDGHLEIVRNFDNFDDVVNYCVENREVVAVEGFSEGDFAILRIFGSTEDSLMIRNFNPSGNWDEDNNFIKKKDISNIAIFDTYCLAVQKICAI